MIIECRGVYQDDNTGSSAIKLVCPGPYTGFPHKLIFDNDGHSIKTFDDICKEPVHYARIAFEPLETTFSIHPNGTMVSHYESKD